MEINGVAHVMLTVSNFEACYPFYEKLLVYLGMKPVMRSEDCCIAWGDGLRWESCAATTRIARRNSSSDVSGCITCACARGAWRRR